MGNITNPMPETNKELIEKFRAMKDVYSLSCVVVDAQERANAMTCDMKPRSVNKKVIGPAFTVKMNTGDLVDYVKVLNYLKEGDVLVVDGFGEKETSIFGGLTGGLAKVIGVAGAIINGSTRDTDELRLLDFPVYSLFVGPRSAHSPYSQRYEPVHFNVPISCGGVTVNPGDLIIADEIGVVVVGKDDMQAVYDKAYAQAELESKTRVDIMAGKTVDELLAKYGRL